MSQRVAQFSNRLVAENEALSEEVENLGADINKALAAATSGVGSADGEWVDDVVQLESAKAIVTGSGPGGDL